MVGGNALMCSTARDGLRSKAVLSNLFDTAGHTRKLSEAMGRNSKLKGGRTKCLGQNGTGYQYFCEYFQPVLFLPHFCIMPIMLLSCSWAMFLAPNWRNKFKPILSVG